VSSTPRARRRPLPPAALPADPGGLGAPARALFSGLLVLMGGRSGAAVAAGPSDAAIRATLEDLHARAASAKGVMTVTEPDAVRPLMEVRAAPCRQPPRAPASAPPSGP
jgi:hypothetical protein